MQDSDNDLDISHLARLAQLALDEDAANAARSQLSNIINMIDDMQKVDTEGVEPMAHPLDATARLRRDEVTERVDVEHFQDGAPDTADGYYLVPRVVE
ncbi:MAG: Asp-tRNA(Asn)/Glu-tRNA(Gln) amidotransferase subunit GatC [Pseudomonadota bacterium]